MAQGRVLHRRTKHRLTFYLLTDCLLPVLQSLAIVLWAFSTLRHEHAGLMEALAQRGLQLLHMPPDEGGLNDTAMAMVFWVRPSAHAAVQHQTHNGALAPLAFMTNVALSLSCKDPPPVRVVLIVSYVGVNFHFADVGRHTSAVGCVGVG